MDIESFLRDASLSPPEEIGSADLRDFLQARYRQYLDLLDRVTKPDADVYKIIRVKSRIVESSNEILAAVDSYFQGYPNEAYCHLENAVTKVRRFFTRLASSSRPGNWLNLRGLYRARVSRERSLERGDLFHIPFDQRRRVGPQRYSITGLPCLYLSSSIYACWEELGRPDFSAFHVSRVEVSESAELKLATIGPMPRYLSSEISRLSASSGPDHAFTLFTIDAAVTVATCWPIVLACSIPTPETSSPFRPEYIIPQLILQWVTRKDSVDGIQYPSVRLSTGNIAPPKYCLNYVFPVKAKHNRIGFCSALSKQFKLTSPLSWQLSEACLPGTRNIHDGFTDEISLNEADQDFNLTPDHGVHYRNSLFGQIESLLKNMKTDIAK